MFTLALGTHKRAAGFGAKIAFSSLIVSSVAGLSACSSHHHNDDPFAGADMSSTAPVASSLDSQKPESDEKAAAIGATTVKTKHTRHHHKRPEIAATPTQSSDGFWLNAYYFVRSTGEDWDAISNTIYGRPDRGELLKAWNKNVRLSPGQVVYYNSPLRPEDSQSMKVFAEDFGFALEKVEVKAGDWLSKIAKERSGDAASWREIAALNPNISDPDSIEVGQVVLVQPIQMDTQTVLNAVIAKLSNDKASDKTLDQNAQNSVAGLTKTPPKSPPPNEVARVAQASNSRVASDASNPTIPQKRTGDPSALLFAIGIGACIGGIVWMIIRKRQGRAAPFRKV